MKILVKLALIAGAVAIAAKFVTAWKAKWQGLTEAETREKVASRLPKRVPDEKREAVADRVVAKMRARGAFGEEEMVVTPAPAESGPVAEQPGRDDAAAVEGPDKDAGVGLSLMAE